MMSSKQAMQQYKRLFDWQASAMCCIPGQAASAIANHFTGQHTFLTVSAEHLGKAACRNELLKCSIPEHFSVLGLC